jgi:MFS family permease
MNKILMANFDTSRFISPVRHKLIALYTAEAVNSIAATLLTVGLPFYMSHRFGWGARENFAVAALQGVFYMLGALSAQRISGRWGREKSMLALYACMTTIACAVGISATMAWAHTTALLVVLETSFMAASWPMLESLVSESGEPSRLSKRLGCYNIVWAITGAIAVAGSGAIIQHTPAWSFFGIVAAGHFLAGGLIFCRTRLAVSNAAALSVSLTDSASSVTSPRSIRDEAEERSHRLALWLSRIALPSTYVIVYSVAPALPSLHAIRQLSPTIATLVGSIWLIARAAAFIITGNTTFWHKRASLMYVASLTMLLAFIGTIVPGALKQVDLLPALAAMAIAQIVLGLSLGTIYSASLYFGMAVSDGSTEHGGYHEALIGLGQIIGPHVGATMQWLRPGSLWPAVIGISGVVSISIVVEAIVGVRASLGIGSPQRVDQADA